MLEQTVLSYVDVVCPIKRKRIRGNAVEWMDSEIIELIRRRDKLKNSLDRNPSPDLKREYNRFRNFAKNRISFKKRHYFKDQFAKLESNSIWKTYHKLTGKSIKQSNDVKQLKLDDGQTVNDKDKIAELLCSTFILEDETTDSEKVELRNLLDNAAAEDLSNIIITPADVLECIYKLKPKSSIQDKIPIKIMKPLLPSLVIPLSIFFSTIFATCNYPTRFKEAIVLPLFKGKGSLVDPNNYRPIASLLSISKLFEYVLKRKLMSGIEAKNVLDNNQHGFRNGRSCTTALTVFSQNIFNQLDKPNNYVVVCFIDLRKGFDSLSHYHLLKMLINVYKLNAKLVILISNFLKNRHYSIKLGKYMSSRCVVNRGIGQGFVTGPNLFILFFNNIAEVLTECFYTGFADDLSVALSGENLNDVIAKMNVKMSNLSEWLIKKGLSMNYFKTKVMIIRKTQCKKLPNVIQPIVINDVEIERVSHYKYLGVIIDEHFTFKNHCESVAKKVCVNIGMLHRLRRFLTPHMLTILINAHVNSVTDYCLTIWGPSRINDFANIQSKVTNLIKIYCYPKLSKFYTKTYWKAQSDCKMLEKAKVECRSLHSDINMYDLLDKFNLLSLTERLQYYSLWNLFKIKKFGTNILEFANMYKYVVSGYHTRCSQKLQLAVHKSALFSKSVQYFSVQIWNSLSGDTISEILNVDPKISGNVRARLTDFVMTKRSNMYV